MLVFLFILLFVIFIIIGIIFSKVEVDIKINYDNFEKDEIRSKEKNERKNIEKNLKYKININMYLYKIRYLRLFKISIDSNYVRFYKYKIRSEKFLKDLIKKANVKKEIKLFKLKYLNLIKYDIKKFYFNSKIYTESNLLTIHFMTFLYTFIFSIIGYLSFKNNANKMEYVYVNIIPLFEDQSINNSFFYQNKKLIKSNINVNMILDISTVSVIKFIYNMNKNKKE